MKKAYLASVALLATLAIHSAAFAEEAITPPTDVPVITEPTEPVSPPSQPVEEIPTEPSVPETPVVEEPSEPEITPPSETPTVENPKTEPEIPSETTETVPVPVAPSESTEPVQPTSPVTEVQEPSEPVTIPTVEQPITTDTGYTIVSTVNSQVVIALPDGATQTVTAETVGGTVNEDNTVTIKTSDGSVTRLPETGESGFISSVLSAFGVGLGTFTFWPKKKK
ncbi:LPXTG cell wall anchor domain-containing protein [Streptococcus suis]